MHNKFIKIMKRPKNETENIGLIKVASIAAAMLFTFLSFSITVVAADLKNLSYWHSDKDKIGHWSLTPIVISMSLSSSFSTALQSGISKAQSEWGKAGIHFNYVSNSWAYHIICYGGTPDELIAVGIQEDFSGITGRTSVLSRSKLA